MTYYVHKPHREVDVGTKLYTLYIDFSPMFSMYITVDYI